MQKQDMNIKSPFIKSDTIEISIKNSITFLTNLGGILENTGFQNKKCYVHVIVLWFILIH